MSKKECATRPIQAHQGNGTDLPCDYGKGSRRRCYHTFIKKKKKVIQEEDVQKQAAFVSHLLTHIHTLGTLWRQFPPGVLFYQTFLVTGNQGVAS